MVPATASSTSHGPFPLPLLPWPRSVRSRGIRLVSPPSPSWEHFAIRIGPGGHPALRNKLVRRALAYGIDRTALVRQVLGSVPTLRRRTTASSS